MKKIYLSILILTGFAIGQIGNRSLSQNSTPYIAPDNSYLSQTVQLIDMPTASIVPGGDFRTSIRLYEQGGVLGKLSVGITDRFMFGISFGGLNIIGESDIEWNKTPGVHVGYRFMEENLLLPALVLGFDSQGYGPFYEKYTYSDSLGEHQAGNRYAVKSRGFYLVASKGYSSFVNFALHAGVNFSMEQAEGNDMPNLFVGLDALLTPDVSLLADYDFAGNDDRVYGDGDQQGLLNVGVRWAFSPNMYIEFDVKNVLAEKENKKDVRRVLKLVYYNPILR